MIISMKPHSSPEEIQAVCQRIEDFGYKIHTIEGVERVVIAAIGVGDTSACLESLEALPQVEKAMRITAPYKFVSREYKSAKTRIRVRDFEIGGGANRVSSEHAQTAAVSRHPCIESDFH